MKRIPIRGFYNKLTEFHLGVKQGCARFADLCANSWCLNCFSHSITMEG